MAFFPADGKAFNLTRRAHLATALAVANTHWTRLRGLLGLGTDDFRNGSGLWIVPCHGVHTLGMGFPIDVLYLDHGLKVVGIQSEVRPWRFTPVLRKAASVLELPCGTAAETKTAVGDTIEITLPKDCTQFPA
ncbi:MAG: DUF192 domain-containing protein [Acidobacteriia bacterium]|nr:DUF192 domain-containing protein [Terriglobia bacterium]